MGGMVNIANSNWNLNTIDNPKPEAINPLELNRDTNGLLSISSDLDLRGDPIKTEDDERTRLLNEINQLEKNVLSSEETVKEYQCFKCDFASESKDEVTRHTSSTHYNKKFKCLQCNFTTPHKD